MRPEGYKNPFEEYHNVFDIPTVQDAEWEAFEAGADAYEKALKKDAMIIRKDVVATIEVHFMGDNPDVKQIKLIEFQAGRVVFLEDE